MTYQYDVEGRLSKVYQTNAPSQGATYAYDATDRLASRTATNGSTTTTTLYVHDIADHIIAETNTAGQTLREYIWLDDLPIAIVDKVNTASPVVYYVHTDHLGRPARLVLAQNWRWAWDVAYGPFGDVAGVWADPGVTQDMRFPGQWFQTESGLAYNWHRHYDASLGRYVQPDPIGYAGGRSLYGYVEQSPLASIDTDGHFPWGLALGAADFAWQFYDNGGNWRCVNYYQIGGSVIGGGLFNAWTKGAFRFKDFGSHTWDATRHWMNNEGIQMLRSGWHRHHWLFERNQGVGRFVPDWIKNQPWNTNPIPAWLNAWLSKHPELAWVGGPSWAAELPIGGLLAGGGCECAQ